MDRTSWKNFLLSAKGRVARKPYNLFLLVQGIIYLLALGADYLRAGGVVLTNNSQAYLSNLVQIIFLWPFIVVTIKRLHDMNYRGWWLVAGFFGPVALSVCAAVLTAGYLMFMGQNPATLLGLQMIVVVVFILSILVLCAFLIILSVRKGTIGPNRFGDDPLQNLSDEKILVSEGV